MKQKFDIREEMPDLTQNEIISVTKRIISKDIVSDTPCDSVAIAVKRHYELL